MVADFTEYIKKEYIMKKIICSSILLLFLAGTFCSGQASQTAPDSQPASSNVRGAEYPRVTPDLKAIFLIKAPDAQKVQIRIGKTYDMVKDDQGIWTVTTEALVPGFHYYFLMIDGVQVSDPASESYFGWGRMSSGIEIPESGIDYYSVKDVPHGDLRSKLYFSKITGKWRRAYIYCPPGYDNNTDERYPSLYLQHGAGEDERGWGVQGKVDIILDNLIAAGKSRPMLIVMDQGYADRAGTPAPGQQNMAEGRPPQGPSAFEEVVIKDLIPFIDATFRTIPDRDHRAMAGLSMGGMQTLQITLSNLDMFSYIAGFSGAGRFSGAGLDVRNDYKGVLSDSVAFNKKVRLLWIGIGTAEPDNMYKAVNGFHLALTKAGIKHVYYESPGTDHEWLTWRRDLYDFAPRLFNY
jgi:enterochelin esterase family protein